MTIRRCRRGVPAVLTAGFLLLASGGSADAQSEQPQPAPLARSFDEVKRHVRAGATVFVTDSSGREVSGTLRELSDTSLSVLVRGRPQVFPATDVALLRQRRPDSLWNGLLFGAAAGTAPAIYWLVADPNECGGSICMDDLARGVFPGAAIGLGIDAAIRRKVVIYGREPEPSARAAFAVTPIVAQRRRGVALVVSF